MDDGTLTAILTGLGLASAAGLNAWIPLLLVGLLGRTGVLDLAAPYDVLESTPVLAVLGVLLVVELLADKVPVVDSVNDVIQTVVRPTAGAVLAVLGVLLVVELLADKVPVVDSVNDVIQTVVRPTAGAVLAAGSVGALSDAPPWIGLVAGLLTAGTVHAGKATVRPVVNASTAGAGGPVVSVVEDVTAVAATFIAIFLPLLVLLMLAAFGYVLWRVRRAWNRRGPQGSGSPAVTPPAPS